MSGYIKLYRTIFESDAFKAEPYSEREAWIWLISNAAWKDHKTRAGNAMVDVARGQCIAASDHLASVWGWSRKRVRTYINLLVSEGMVEKGQSKGRLANMLTICNYEKYQSDNEQEGQLEGRFRAGSGPVQGHTEEGKELKEEDVVVVSARDEIEGLNGATVDCVRLVHSWMPGLYPNEIGPAENWIRSMILETSSEATKSAILQTSRRIEGGELIPKPLNYVSRAAQCIHAENQKPKQQQQPAWKSHQEQKNQDFKALLERRKAKAAANGVQNG